MSHTPGPWTAIGAFIENRHSGIAVCKTMCRLNDEGHFPVESEADANARLIAAAPDLLESLKAMLDDFCGYDMDKFDKELAAKAEAAIAKAEGK
jgi:hypothetical protein